MGIPADGARETDAEGLAVAPGFIDLHTHCDFTLPKYPRADSMVHQGVTTVVVGNLRTLHLPGRRGRATRTPSHL